MHIIQVDIQLIFTHYSTPSRNRKIEAKREAKKRESEEEKGERECEREDVSR